MLAYFRIFLLLAIATTLVVVLVQARKMMPSDTPVLARDNAGMPMQPRQDSVQMGVPTKIVTSLAQLSRDVGAGVIASTNEQVATLERIDPLPQPTPPPLPKPIEPKKPKNIERWRLVYNTVATSAGVFQITDNAFVLPGIDVVSADERCKLDNGETWPCGMVARTSLRSFINGKALTCKLPDFMTEKSFIADCRLRGRDLAQWLVANGWARAKLDGPYLADQADAELKRHGIYGAPPTGVGTLAQ